MTISFMNCNSTADCGIMVMENSSNQCAVIENNEIRIINKGN